VVFPELSALELFAAASVALLLIPGPAVLYIITQSAEQGRSAGLASVAGIHIGTLVHIVAAAAGLSALIAASAVAFTAVKLAGAAYLIWLGIRKLLERTPLPDVARQRPQLRRSFARGAVVNVLNPKTALFFLAFLPQFVDTDRGAVWSQVVALGLVFVALGSLATPRTRWPVTPSERSCAAARRRCAGSPERYMSGSARSPRSLGASSTAVGSP
jgi:threonine/homoserine/homoserine lactone efflux protein